MNKILECIKSFFTRKPKCDLVAEGLNSLYYLLNARLLPPNSYEATRVRDMDEIKTAALQRIATSLESICEDVGEMRASVDRLEQHGRMR